MSTKLGECERQTPHPSGYHTPSPTRRRETGYLHATVRHGHGIIGQGVAGDLAVVGAGGWCKDIAGTYVIRINGVVSLEGPTGKVQEHGHYCPPETQVTSRDPRMIQCTVPHLVYVTLSLRSSCKPGQMATKRRLVVTDSPWREGSWVPQTLEDEGPPQQRCSDCQGMNVTDS